jgi:hypothetical protein
LRVKDGLRSFLDSSGMRPIRRDLLVIQIQVVEQLYMVLNMDLCGQARVPVSHERHLSASCHLRVHIGIPNIEGLGGRHSESLQYPEETLRMGFGLGYIEAGDDEIEQPFQAVIMDDPWHAVPAVCSNGCSATRPSKALDHLLDIGLQPHEGNEPPIIQVLAVDLGLLSVRAVREEEVDGLLRSAHVHVIELILSERWKSESFQNMIIKRLVGRPRVEQYPIAIVDNDIRTFPGHPPSSIIFLFYHTPWCQQALRVFGPPENRR